MAREVSDIIASGKVINVNTLYVLSGQMNTYFIQWCQEFVADKNRTVDGYIAKLDQEFDNISKTK